MDNLDFWSGVFMFKNMSLERISIALSKVNIEKVSYKRREEISSPKCYKRRLGFIYSGKCKIERIKHDGASVPLNIILENDSFGILSVLSDEEEYPTRITAIQDTVVLYFSLEDTRNLINNFNEIAVNFVDFLAKKVVFLNKKIAAFSEDSVEDKFACYLLNEARKNGAEFPFNCKKTAEALSVGRASLYRAISSMTEENIIRLENKKIYVLDLEGLERKTQ